MERIIRKVNQVIPNLNEKVRVAAYARVSSGKDAMLHSLSAQISHYSELIQSNPKWEYVGVYADEAITGTSKNRTQFQEMLEKCRAGEVDLVLTKSISRFARNTLVLLEVVRELKALGIDIYFENEKINSMSGDGELLLTILASFAQAESLSVSENCKWRIRKGFAEGELVNFRYMFGYSVTGKEVLIEPNEAAIVQWIFTQYANGIGSYTIAKTIGSMNVKRTFGGKWKSQRVIEILRNEKYTGNALLQKSFVKDHLTKKLVNNRGELPMYYAELSHPPIVTQALFDLVQERLNSKVIKTDPAESFLFSRMIKCSKCHKTYRRKRKGENYTWHCSTYLEFGKAACASVHIPDSILREMVSKRLGIHEVDEAIVNQQIEEIIILDENKVKIQFKNGKSFIETWTKKSRKDSWTQEMKDSQKQQAHILKERWFDPCLWQERSRFYRQQQILTSKQMNLIPEKEE